MDQYISQEIFNDYQKCDFKVYLNSINKKSSKSEYEKNEIQLKKEYATIAFKKISKNYPKEKIINSPKSLENKLTENYSIISNTHASFNNLVCYAECIVIQKNQSGLRCIPFKFLYNDKISKDDKLCLAYTAYTISKKINCNIKFGRIVYGLNYISTKVYVTRLFPLVKQIITCIDDIFNNKIKPKICLNKHCPVCVYKDYCQNIAKNNDDLSLLRGLSEKAIKKLNKKGIFSVTQLSYTFRPRKQRKKKSDTTLSFNPSLQSLAIRNDRVYVLQRPNLPELKQIVYIDIEGIPGRSFYYLIGLRVNYSGLQRTYSLWAKTKDEERNIWQSLLDILNKYRRFTVAHYGSYDIKALKIMQSRYGGNEIIVKQLFSSSINVLSLIYGNIYFPVYSNDLKSISSCLRFKYSTENPSGLQAILWRHKWEITHNQKYKRRLIKYNQEDCLALQHVMETIISISFQNKPLTIDDKKKVVEINDLVANSWPNIYKRNEFFAKAFDRVNRCAYFDYQMEKIYVRTSKSVKQSIKRAKRKSKRKTRINKFIELPRPNTCPKCSSSKVYKHYLKSKTVNDLKLFESGIKRWVVRYESYRYRCMNCKRTFLPINYPTTTYGHVLRSWVIYQNIALLRSQSSIVQEMRDIFNFDYSWSIVSYFKSHSATFYKQTYLQIFKRIKSGNIIHADETKISIKGIPGYIWVFTNLEDVVYVYTDTREGKIIDQVVEGFSGVLISDFYPAYDSPTCQQQKCLIHLIRDINDDLFKNPFDDDLKWISSKFTGIIVPIIECIDKYGLKKRNLNKFKKPALSFLKETSNKCFSSEIADGYKKRFKKNEDKLFTFLQHDGVPWNNNNAENAIKRFVFLRKVIGGSSSKNGINEYLILLSIRESLRRRNINFLKFLISKKTDIINI